MPAELTDLWARFARCETAPDSCLINLYRDGARMGLHVDADEDDLTGRLYQRKHEHCANRESHNGRDDSVVI